MAVNAIPIIAFAPIANNWFGIQSPMSKMAVAASLVFFPIMINTLRGLTQVEPSALELMRSYAAGEGSVTRHLRVPNALPYFLTGLKIATTLALIGAVVGEYFGGLTVALGRVVVGSASALRFDITWAAIVVVSLMGIAMYLVVLASSGGDSLASVRAGGSAVVESDRSEESAGHPPASRGYTHEGIPLTLSRSSPVAHCCSAACSPAESPADRHRRIRSPRLRSAGESQTAAEPASVRLQLQWTPQAQFGGYYAAEEQGYYADENLTVEFLPGGGDIVPQQAGSRSRRARVHDRLGPQGSPGA